MENKSAMYIGADYNERDLIIGFISPQGIRKGLTVTMVPFHGNFGETFSGAVRGLRGDENLRMKNFRAIGIGVATNYLNSEVAVTIKEQIKSFLDIPVYIEDRDKLAETGKNWLTSIGVRERKAH